MIDRLLQLKEAYPLNENYKWKLPTMQFPIPIPGFVIPQGTPYQENVFLKENLQHHFVPDMTLDLHYWVIRKWGGIRRFGMTAAGEDHVNNQQRITDFGMELNEETLTRASCQVLPSLSKVASFQFPDRYAIYDSRSIFH